MKKTDLEKLKGKKLDIRQSQAAGSNHFGGANKAARDQRAKQADGQSLIGRMLQQALPKK